MDSNQTFVPSYLWGLEIAITVHLPGNILGPLVKLLFSSGIIIIQTDIMVWGLANSQYPHFHFQALVGGVSQNGSNVLSDGQM